MKYPIFIFFVFFSSCIERPSEKDKISRELSFEESRDTMFKFHFNILDSVANSRKMDSLFYCCTASIEFMELYTGIDGQKDGTTLGKLAFTKRDLERWHEWFANVKLIDSGRK